jgi:DNA-binding IscR family transcriptional regulator
VNTVEALAGRIGFFTSKKQFVEPHLAKAHKKQHKTGSSACCTNIQNETTCTMKEKWQLVRKMVTRTVATYTVGNLYVTQHVKRHSNKK